MSYLISKQYLKIKSLIVDINNCLNKVFPAFDSLNKELFPSFHLVDNFPSYFSFYSVNWRNTNAKAAYWNKLNDIYKIFSINQNTILIISDMSVKNNIITLVLHIWRKHKIITKTIYYTMNILSIKAKLFAIRYSISQATQMQDVEYIVIITDAISGAKWIFDLSVYPYQLYTIIIFSNSRNFFNKSENNSISFWDCSNSNKWPFYLLVDKESKQHKINPIL